MYSYQDYQRTRDAAWRILIDADVRELPVRAGAICSGMGIKVISYADGAAWIGGSGLDAYRASGDGFCLPGAIFYDDASPLPRQRFTVAHELGHLVLGHVSVPWRYNREPSPGDSPMETAANGFAARLLAPACVLWGCHARTFEDIIHLCDISRAAAEFRMERMTVLYARQKFLTSPLERRLYANFEDFIKKNRL